MLQEAKNALDKIIRKGRIHFYKPIQIAEILYHSRLELDNFDVSNIGTYRNPSKRWRDEVTQKLVGRVSTSSQKYQDNLFDDNAVPPHLLELLIQVNNAQEGMVENYIYHRFKERQQDVLDAYAYLIDSTTDTFVLAEFLNYFEHRAGLKRSVDKAFEIVVYALFSTIVHELQAQITLTLNQPDPAVIADFNKFIEYVLGLQNGETSTTLPATMYRGGVTNAADRGLDIVTNFGPSIQVKHLRLNETVAEDISESIALDDIVIVCKTADAKIIHSILNQMGIGIRGIITQDNLEEWYDLCHTKYASQMGENLLESLILEFTHEFPLLDQLQSFLDERGYAADDLHGQFFTLS